MYEIQDQVIDLQARIDRMSASGETKDSLLAELSTLTSETDDEEILGQLAQMESELISS